MVPMVTTQISAKKTSKGNIMAPYSLFLFQRGRPSGPEIGRGRVGDLPGRHFGIKSKEQGGPAQNPAFPHFAEFDRIAGV
jgi:hypothetical protein